MCLTAIILTVRLLVATIVVFNPFLADEITDIGIEISVKTSIFANVSCRI